MDNDSMLTVIIPTTAEIERALSLCRAIKSIQEQKDIQAKILLVINGCLFDKELFASLQKRNDLKVLYREEGNLPKAIHFGVINVTTPFYCFLDDDDSYIENTLHERLQPLLNDNAIDYVISNGFNNRKGVDVQRTTNFPTNQDNAASLILEENWLASSGGVYRISSIGAEFFENMPKYLEWTYLGFKIAIARKGFFLATPAFRIYESDSSLSKSGQYTKGMVQGFQEIIKICPKALKKQVETKYGKMLHNVSLVYLKEGEIILAIKSHMYSLIMPSGYLYLFYTRKILIRLPCAIFRYFFKNGVHNQN